MNSASVSSKANIIGIPADDPRYTNPVSQEIGSNGKPKRNTFACSSCHAVKQRCIPTDANDIYRKPCTRCLKFKKLCVFDLSKRTRRKRRSNHVAAAAASAAKNGNMMHSVLILGRNSRLPDKGHFPQSQHYVTKDIHRHQAPQSTNWDNASPLEVFSERPSNQCIDVARVSPGVSTLPAPFPPPSLVHGSVDHDQLTDPEGEDVEENDDDDDRGKALLRQEFGMLSDCFKEKLGHVSERLSIEAKKWNLFVESAAAIPIPSDPVAIGILSAEDAMHRLELYEKYMLSEHQLSFIRIPKYDSIKQFRLQQPILFSTLLAVASVVMPHSPGLELINMKLDNLVLTHITHYCMRNGEKAVELLKSLILLCLWYNFPEWSNKSRYHHFNYLCYNLVRELSVAYMHKSLTIIGENHDQHKVGTILEEDPDYPRLILLVYISSLSISIFLHQPIQLKWFPMVEKACNDILSGEYVSELYSVEENQMLVTFAKLHLCLDRTYTMLSENSDGDFVTIDQENLINVLVEELTVIKMQIPARFLNNMTYFYTVEAYVYESVVSSYFLKNTNPAASLPENIGKAFTTAAQKSLSALKGLLDLDPNIVVSLPLLNISRVVYTMGMALLRLRYTSITVPSFEHLKSSTVEILPVLQRFAIFLDELNEKFPYNRAISKLQYVAALFIHTYSNKLRTCIYDGDSPFESFESLHDISSTTTFDINSHISKQDIRDYLKFDAFHNGTLHEFQSDLLKMTSIMDQRDKKLHNIKVNSIHKSPVKTHSFHITNGQAAREPTAAAHMIDYLSDYLVDNAFVENEYDAFNEEVCGSVLFNQLK
ncbi:War1p Ecym_1135 [Eremothecium cymbalariae DBVPG|uniref:Zn(2)-C6 fungal-type domain-containing protein n=1 Tax=Eremothecium cymbalariae (strain CBS 270.75 / DBVPG 7215 / KCTC 17166 / NRRL Y-17582) TaxID=931890 RepID=G8JMN2_ERECY|nr:hypothetical protein Ecym_1135 [Eremothecium cymbalariae DBVPG\